MNTQEYSDLARITASWAHGIRNGQAVLVAETLERVSAYCLEQAGVPDEYMREAFRCPCVNAVGVSWWKLLCRPLKWWIDSAHDAVILAKSEYSLVFMLLYW